MAASILTERGKHSVDFFQPIETRNDMGEVEISWNATPYCTRFALVTSRSGNTAATSSRTNREYWRANQLHAEADFILSARGDEWTLRVRPNWSIVMRGRRMQIVSVENVNEMDTELRFGVRELVSYA